MLDVRYELVSLVERWYYQLMNIRNLEIGVFCCRWSQWSGFLWNNCNTIAILVRENIITRLAKFTAAWLAQLVGRRTAVREVEGSSPRLCVVQTGPTLRVFKELRRMCCLRIYICKWLDYLVFSDKTERKTQAPSPSPTSSVSRGR